MQDTTVDRQPGLLGPAIHFGLAAAVAFGLTSIVAVASSASHVSVRHLVAEFQDSSRVVTLPPVEIVGRRDLASGASARGDRSAAASTGCAVLPS